MRIFFKVVFCFAVVSASSQDFIALEKNEEGTFDRVKNLNGIAIDIGTWTHAIWLSASKNFSHVIAIEPEQLSSMTFKQLLYDCVYANKSLAPHNVSFIECDVGGMEEGILEDVLHYAYNNEVKVHLSFHVDQWKSKKVADFEYLFAYFKITDGNTEITDVAEYLNQQASRSFLLEPVERGVLVKKNISVVIIGYNQYTFIKNMVEQLEKYTSDIIIVDNKSTYGPLLNYYENEFKYTLLRQEENFGHVVYGRAPIQKLVGDLYIITDPDLKFNPNLPAHFIQDFIDISNYFEAERVGFSLLVDADDIRTDSTFFEYPIKKWESRFWTRRLTYPPNRNIELYRADIDTTFCLVNRRHIGPAIRVAGDYTCVHIPWHNGFEKLLQEGEYESYLNKNQSTTWFKIKPEGSQPED